MTKILLSLTGLIVGGFIGLAFGVIQIAAQNRNKKKKEEGHLKSGLVMLGSMHRVAFLMMALVLVQIGMPILFNGEGQWMVSVGVMLGYGWMLYVEYRRKVQTL